jgi:ABC-type multidrug transport system fused ATPase/permease subunit
MLFVVPHFLTSQFFVVRHMQKLNKESLEATAKNTGEMTALITCADVALLYDGQDYLMKRFEKSSLELLRAKMKIWKRNSLNAVIAILPFGLPGYLILLIVSGAWIAQGQLTFGDLTAAFQYRLGVLIGANMLINCIVSIKASMAGIQRINETVYEKTEGTNG